MILIEDWRRASRMISNAASGDRAWETRQFKTQQIGKIAPPWGPYSAPISACGFKGRLIRAWGPASSGHPWAIWPALSIFSASSFSSVDLDVASPKILMDLTELSAEDVLRAAADRQGLLRFCSPIFSPLKKVQHLDKLGEANSSLVEQSRRWTSKNVSSRSCLYGTGISMMPATISRREAFIGEAPDLSDRGGPDLRGGFGQQPEAGRSAARS